MNKDRRKQIQAIRTDLENLQGRVNELKEEEQQTFDDMPEGFQQGERGEATQTAIDALDAAANSIGEAADSLTEAEGA